MGPYMYHKSQPNVGNMHGMGCGWNNPFTKYQQDIAVLNDKQHRLQRSTRIGCDEHHSKPVKIGSKYVVVASNYLFWNG